MLIAHFTYRRWFANEIHRSCVDRGAQAYLVACLSDFLVGRKIPTGKPFALASCRIPGDCGVSGSHEDCVLSQPSFHSVFHCIVSAADLSFPVAL